LALLLEEDEAKGSAVFGRRTDLQLRDGEIVPFPRARIFSVGLDTGQLVRAQERAQLWMENGAMSMAAAQQAIRWFLPPAFGELRAESGRLTDIKHSAPGEFIRHLMHADHGVYFLDDIREVIAGRQIYSKNPRILAALEAAKGMPSLLAEDSNKTAVFPISSHCIYELSPKGMIAKLEGLDSPEAAERRVEKDLVKQDEAARANSPVERLAQQLKAVEMGMSLFAIDMMPECEVGCRGRGRS